MSPTRAQDYQQSNVEPIRSTIPVSQTKSEIIRLQGTTVAGVYIPAVFTGLSITFESSYDGINFFPIYDGGSVLSVVVDILKYIPLSPQLFYGVRFLKIVSSIPEPTEPELIIIPYPI